MTYTTRAQRLMKKTSSAGAKKRKPISTRTRFEVLKRDSFRCQYCGASPDTNLLHVDHITPVALGGGNQIANLVTACDKCNLGKGAVSLEKIPKSLEELADQMNQPTIAKYQEAVEAHEMMEFNQLITILDLMHPDGWKEFHVSQARPIERAISNLGFNSVSVIAKDAGNPWVRDKFAYLRASIKNKYQAIGGSR